MSASLSGVFNVQEFDDNGTLLVSGRLYTYAPSTTILKTAYTDAAASVPHTYTSDGAGGQYIALNARGELPAGLFLTAGGYDLALKRADGTLVKTYRATGQDDISLTFQSNLASTSDATQGTSLIGNKSSLTGAVGRLLNLKLAEWVSVTDFGAKGDGTTDDTAAINAALAASKHVVVPAGLTPLISSTIAVPAATKLQFLGGYGNTTGAYPASYFVKKSTMTTVGITVADRAWVEGGGIVGQTSNTGDGIQIIGNNARISNFLVHAAGGNGVRVGTSGGANCNSFMLDHVTSQYNGGSGFYVHDGTAAAAANANAGTVLQCFAQHNAIDGIHLGHCFWVTVINCLSEVNTGWGLYLEGTNDSSGVPVCRYATVVGGDYNEGNTAGQVFDQGYFSNFNNPDPASCPTTAGNGLAGSGVRNVIGSQGANQLVGGKLLTNSGATPFTMDDGVQGNMSYPLIVKKQTSNGNTQGVGIQFSLSTGSGYSTSGQLRHLQYSINNWGWAFDGYKAGVLSALLAIDPTSGIYPGADNTYTCGNSANRWSQLYAATSVIATSDERSKQDIEDVPDAWLDAWADVKWSRYRFKDAAAKKGDAARWHIGLVAQRVRDAFAARGLDALQIGLLCFDAWDAQAEERDEAGNVLVPAREAGDRYGIRYEEALAMEAALMRREVERLKAGR